MKHVQFEKTALTRGLDIVFSGRRMPRALLVGVITAFLAACNTTPATQPEKRLPTDAEVEQYNASVAPEERIVCRVETPIGSNIPKRVCRLVVDVEETSTFHRDQLRRSLF